MDNKILEIFIPGPAGRLEAKYYKSKKNTSPIALVLQPHPQYGGTMNNKVVVDTFHTFMDNDFSVCRVNFRGVGKSDGEFDNGQGELADAAAALDWLERENFDNSQCWVSGFSFGSLIAMQLLMRRPEINRFIAISPQPNVYDFSFLSPCPTSGLMIYGKKDELVPLEYITELDKRLSAQKGIKVEFQSIPEANHFFSKTEDALIKNLEKYITKHEDITRDGIIGNYVHGNEPGHHIPYLYNWTGHPKKTQERVRMIMNTMYGPTVEGLCGNDDAGQMSAWYIFSSLGFYPVTPGSLNYALGSPLIKEAVIHLENGEDLSIIANNQSKENIYVKSVTVNGITIKENLISHTDIENGGTLIFEMTNKKN